MFELEPLEPPDECELLLTLTCKLWVEELLVPEELWVDWWLTLTVVVLLSVVVVLEVLPLAGMGMVWPFTSTWMLLWLAAVPGGGSVPVAEVSGLASVAPILSIAALSGLPVSDLMAASVLLACRLTSTSIVMVIKNAPATTRLTRRSVSRVTRAVLLTGLYGLKCTAEDSSSCVCGIAASPYGRRYRP